VKAVNGVSISYLTLPAVCYPYFTSSRMVVRGNSGPYLSFFESPSLHVTGLALPYGLPRLFIQMTKNLDISNARPGPPRRGPHQSLTSALPVRAWHITIALSRFGESLPLVLYARGTLCNVTPDSNVKDEMMAIVWSGMREENGFSGCCRCLSWTYSVAVDIGRRGRMQSHWTLCSQTCCYFNERIVL